MRKIGCLRERLKLYSLEVFIKFAYQFNDLHPEIISRIFLQLILFLNSHILTLRKIISLVNNEYPRCPARFPSAHLKHDLCVPQLSD